MNRDDIIRMADDAGLAVGSSFAWDNLERSLIDQSNQQHNQRTQMNHDDIIRMAQEPVAWMVYTLDGKSVCVTDNPSDFTDVHPALPLFTSPNLRKPLTDEEIDEMIAKAVAAEREACAKAAENQWETLGTQRRTAERCAAAIRARGEE